MPDKMEEKLQALGNVTTLPKRVTQEEMARIDAAIAHAETLIKEHHDRRRGQQPYAGEDKRHGDRRRAPREQED